MHTVYYIILIVSSALFSAMTIAGAYLLLVRAANFDMPDERSNHTTPVPTGLGIAFMTICIGFLLVANAKIALILAAVLLTVTSFMDDMKSQPILHRLGFQAIAVIMCLTTIDGQVFQGLLPIWAEYLVITVLWLWFINLYNFMDGIDEITITETGCITIGLVILGLFVEEVPRYISIDAVIIAACVLVFYPWNAHPAKAFMGDAGSIPLGLLIGYLLLNTAASGHWQAALILPAYYLCDAGITLLRRAMRGEKIWQAHSEHFYQKAVRLGRSHHHVAQRILALNLFLITLACLSIFDHAMGYGALVLAYISTLILLYRFTQPSRTVPHDMVAKDAA